MQSTLSIQSAPELQKLEVTHCPAEHFLPRGHKFPSSTFPSQSLSLLSQTSFAGSIAPIQLANCPLVLQVCVPNLHSPTSVTPQLLVCPGVHSPIGLFSQKLSTLPGFLQTSVVKLFSSLQSRSLLHVLHCPVCKLHVFPGRQLVVPHSKQESPS